MYDWLERRLRKTKWENRTLKTFPTLNLYRKAPWVKAWNENKKLTDFYEIVQPSFDLVSWYSGGLGGNPDPHQTYRLFENEILTSTGSYIIFYTTTWEIYAQLL